MLDVLLSVPVMLSAALWHHVVLCCMAPLNCTPVPVGMVFVVLTMRCYMQYPICLDLLEEGKIDCEPLITHRFGFSEKDIVKGFETAAAAGKTGAIKVMFNW